METSSIHRRTTITFGPPIVIFFDPNQPTSERLPMNHPPQDRWSNACIITTTPLAESSSSLDCKPRQPRRR
jgi:hypothetical protein